MADGTLQRIHTPNVVLAVLLVVLVAASLAVSDSGIRPLYALSMVVAVAFLLVTAYQPVRDHDWYQFGTALVLTVLFGLWWVSAERPALFPAAVTLLAAAGTLVELYNLRAGTSYLRFGD